MKGTATDPRQKEVLVSPAMSDRSEAKRGVGFTRYDWESLLKNLGGKKG